jgi:hypothetical protein
MVTVNKKVNTFFQIKPKPDIKKLIKKLIVNNVKCNKGVLCLPAYCQFRPSVSFETDPLWGQRIFLLQQSSNKLNNIFFSFYVQAGLTLHRNDQVISILWISAKNDGKNGNKICLFNRNINFSVQRL